MEHLTKGKVIDAITEKKSVKEIIKEVKAQLETLSEVIDDIENQTHEEADADAAYELENALFDIKSSLGNGNGNGYGWLDELSRLQR